MTDEKLRAVKRPNGTWSVYRELGPHGDEEIAKGLSESQARHKATPPKLSAIEKKFLLQLWDNPSAADAGRDRKRWMQVVERLTERGYLYEEEEWFWLTNKGRLAIGEPEDPDLPPTQSD